MAWVRHPNTARIGHQLTGALVLLLCASAGDAIAQSYRLVEFSPLPGETSAVAYDLNDQLQIVGSSGEQACVWNAAGEGRPLGLMGAATVINSHGVIAGTQVVAGRVEPFIWTNGVVTRPPIPPGDSLRVQRLTDNGILLMTTSSGTWAAVGDTLYDLRVLTGAFINDVNEAGTMGGTTGPYNTVGYVRYLDGRVVTALGATVQVVGPGGHIGGWSGQGFFFVAPDGSVTTVPRLFFRFAGVLHDANRQGVFVGADGFIQFGFGTSAIIFRSGRVSLLAVGRSDVNVQSAYAINDAGYILASARIAGAPASTVLLVPAAPLAPTNLSASVTGGIVTLTWTPSPGASEYVLEAGSVPGAANLVNAAIGSQPGLTTLAPPGRYYVRVRARSESGVSEPSGEVIVDVP